MNLSGSRNKKYVQSGNKDLGCGCDLASLQDHILDDKATEVVADPGKRVNDEVEKVVRGAISNAISKAFQYALDESLSNTINI